MGLSAIKVFIKSPSFALNASGISNDGNSGYTSLESNALISVFFFCVLMEIISSLANSTEIIPLMFAIAFVIFST